MVLLKTDTFFIKENSALVDNSTIQSNMNSMNNANNTLTVE